MASTTGTVGQSNFVFYRHRRSGSRLDWPGSAGVTHLEWNASSGDVCGSVVGDCIGPEDVWPKAADWRLMGNYVTNGEEGKYASVTVAGPVATRVTSQEIHGFYERVCVRFYANPRLHVQMQNADVGRGVAVGLVVRHNAVMHAADRKRETETALDVLGSSGKKRGASERVLGRVLESGTKTMLVYLQKPDMSWARGIFYAAAVPGKGSALFDSKTPPFSEPKVPPHGSPLLPPSPDVPPHGSAHGSPLLPKGGVAAKKVGAVVLFEKAYAVVADADVTDADINAFDAAIEKVDGKILVGIFARIRGAKIAKVDVALLEWIPQLANCISVPALCWYVAKKAVVQPFLGDELSFAMYGGEPHAVIQKHGVWIDYQNAVKYIRGLDAIQRGNILLFGFRVGAPLFIRRLCERVVGLIDDDLTRHGFLDDEWSAIENVVTDGVCGGDKTCVDAINIANAMRSCNIFLDKSAAYINTFLPTLFDKTYTHEECQLAYFGISVYFPLIKALTGYLDTVDDFIQSVGKICDLRKTSYFIGGIVTLKGKLMAMAGAKRIVISELLTGKKVEGWVDFKMTANGYSVGGKACAVEPFEVLDVSDTYCRILCDFAEQLGDKNVVRGYDQIWGSVDLVSAVCAEHVLDGKLQRRHPLLVRALCAYFAKPLDTYRNGVEMHNWVSTSGILGLRLCGTLNEETKIGGFLKDVCNGGSFVVYASYWLKQAHAHLKNSDFSYEGEGATHRDDATRICTILCSKTQIIDDDMIIDGYMPNSTFFDDLVTDLERVLRDLDKRCAPYFAGVVVLWNLAMGAKNVDFSVHGLAKPYNNAMLRAFLYEYSSMHVTCMLFSDAVRRFFVDDWVDINVKIFFAILRGCIVNGAFDMDSFKQEMQKQRRVIIDQKAAAAKAAAADALVEQLKKDMHGVLATDRGQLSAAADASKLGESAAPVFAVAAFPKTADTAPGVVKAESNPSAPGVVDDEEATLDAYDAETFFKACIREYAGDKIVLYNKASMFTMSGKRKDLRVIAEAYVYYYGKYYQMRDEDLFKLLREHPNMKTDGETFLNNCVIRRCLIRLVPEDVQLRREIYTKGVDALIATNDLYFMSLCKDDMFSKDSWFFRRMTGTKMYGDCVGDFDGVRAYMARILLKNVSVTSSSDYKYMWAILNLFGVDSENSTIKTSKQSLGWTGINVAPINANILGCMLGAFMVCDVRPTSDAAAKFIKWCISGDYLLTHVRRVCGFIGTMYLIAPEHVPVIDGMDIRRMADLLACCYMPVTADEKDVHSVTKILRVWLRTDHEISTLTYDYMMNMCKPDAKLDVKYKNTY